MVSIEEEGLLSKHVKITTEGGQTITYKNAVEAICVPLQKLSVITQMEYYRTYCIAIYVPKGVIEDCLINDQADPYHYIRSLPMTIKTITSSPEVAITRLAKIKKTVVLRRWKTGSASDLHRLAR